MIKQRKESVKIYSKAGREDLKKREEKEKTPHYFTRKDTKSIYFAGIFEKDQFCLITEDFS